MPAEAAWCLIYRSTSSGRRRRRRKREAANEARPHRRRCHRPGVVALSVTYGSLFTIYQTGQALSAQRAPVWTNGPQELLVVIQIRVRAARSIALGACGLCQSLAQRRQGGITSDNIPLSEPKNPSWRAH